MNYLHCGDTPLKLGYVSYRRKDHLQAHMGNCSYMYSELLSVARPESTSAVVEEMAKSSDTGNVAAFIGYLGI
jgi:hypothetical protein